MAAMSIEFVEKKSHKNGRIKNSLREHQWSLRVQSYDTEFNYYSSSTPGQLISHLRTREDHGGLRIGWEITTSPKVDVQNLLKGQPFQQ